VLSLSALAEQLVARRRAIGLTQTALAKQARVSRSTIDALENGRIGELGYNKITNILAALGLELSLRESTRRRPTLDDLMAEEREGEQDDQGLDRRR
jgi:transcriptional regulator with XRE-family HTH domain